MTNADLHIRRETAISMVINTVLSGVFFLAVFGLHGPVPIWGMGHYVFDFGPQAFAVAFMSTLVPGALSRKALRAGRVASRPSALRLPGNLLLRGLILAVPSAMLALAGAAAVAEAGSVYGSGLNALGLSPDTCIVVEARSLIDGLRATLEGARCAALHAVVLETVAPIDLTASRRLKLASEKSGVEIVLIRHGARVTPNAAQVRWRVQGAPLMDPDGRRPPTFEAVVLKSSSGLDGRSCIVEWDHERQCFSQTVSQSVDAVPVVGSLAA